MTTTTEPIDPEEEAKLAAFLTKISGACKDDPEVPGEVGNQVNAWLAEMMAGGNAAGAPAGGNVIDLDAQTGPTGSTGEAGTGNEEAKNTE